MMHIVSSVEGKLSAGKTPDDLMRATFPPGTVSGAPKIRAHTDHLRTRRHDAGAVCRLRGLLQLQRQSEQMISEARTAWVGYVNLAAAARGEHGLFRHHRDAGRRPQRTLAQECVNVLVSRLPSPPKSPATTPTTIAFQQVVPEYLRTFIELFPSQKVAGTFAGT